MSVLRLPYIKGRPALILKILSRQKIWKNFAALLDSGADFSIFPSYEAIKLGIPLQRRKKIKVDAADGDSFFVSIVSLRVKFGKKIFRMPIGFSDRPNITPLIGRAGFFETFRVEFFEREKQICIRNYN